MGEGFPVKTLDQLRDTWPNLEIKRIAQGKASGTHDFFMSALGLKGKELASGTIESEDDGEIVTLISEQEGSIGFVGFSHYANHQKELKAISIRNGNSTVVPTFGSNADGSYKPFSRILYNYINVEALSDPKVKKFFVFYLKNTPRLAHRLGFVALSSEAYKAQIKNLENNFKGHY